MDNDLNPVLPRPDVEGQVYWTRSDVDQLERTLRALAGRVTASDYVDQLERRYDEQLRLTEQLTAQLDRVDEDLSALNHRCASLEQDVYLLKTDHQRAGNDLSDVRRDVERLVSDVQNVQRGW